jgi:hypothetical protein
LEQIFLSLLGYRYDLKQYFGSGFKIVPQERKRRGLRRQNDGFVKIFVIKVLIGSGFSESGSETLV